MLVIKLLMTWLRKKFGECLINRPERLTWTHQILSSGFLKDIYQGNTPAVVALKTDITEKIQMITEEECAHVISNFARRI